MDCRRSQHYAKYNNYNANVLYTDRRDIAGINTSPFQYGGLVPLVAIYKINYPAYYNATGTTGTGVTKTLQESRKATSVSKGSRSA